MLTKKYLIVISGATATGKTALAIQIAQALQCPILSCDSRQFYQEMNIGTAKASPIELAMAKHYFINSLSIQDNYSVGDFEKDALELLKKIHSRQAYAILAGGSGLFIKALCEGLDEFPPVDPAIRAALIDDFEKKGLSVLQQELQEKDPAYATKVDMQNPQRIIRALAVIRTQQKPFSSFLSGQKTIRPFEPIYINLQVARASLYERINQRVDQMMAAGLLEEVKALRAFQQLNSLQTVGYQELFDYFDQKHDLATAVELIKRNSRRYAKRQMTWFRRAGHWKHFAPTEAEQVLQYIQWSTANEIRLQRYEAGYQQSVTQFCQAYFAELNLAKLLNQQLLLALRGGKVIALAWHQKNTALQIYCAPAFREDRELRQFLQHEMNFN